MRKVLLFIFALLSLTACGIDEGTPTSVDGDVNGNDIVIIDKEVDGINYRCLYLYVDGYQAGGPTMWCERIQQ